jgi:carbonic anhydrase
MKSMNALLVAAALLALAACNRPEGNAIKPRADHPPEGHDQSKGHAEQAHWGYTGDIGPAHWADLSPEFALCGSGKRQSPIDLSGASRVKDVTLERRLGPTVLSIEQRARVMDLIDNGHTIQITNDVEVHVEIDGRQYDLVQYHFHAPSEHTIDGRYWPLEAHLVHKSADGQLAVVGVLFEEGKHDPIWDPILTALPSGPGGERHIENLDLDPGELQPLEASFFRYEGSLTTPPCSEGVQWIVMAEHPQLSREQLDLLDSHLHDNNRPVQPLGDRRLSFVKR